MDDGRDKTDVLRRLGMMIANLTEHDRQAICRRCQNVFSYNAARFRSRGLSLPRHCYYCRQAKRNEHEQTT
jgi:late competence protein required for DNA uptake (superfamily II DNA/RNA helicase)